MCCFVCLGSAFSIWVHAEFMDFSFSFLGCMQNSYIWFFVFFFGCMSDEFNWCLFGDAEEFFLTPGVEFRLSHQNILL
jgi:hypothetical protein